MPVMRELKKTAQARLRADRRYRRSSWRKARKAFGGDLDTGSAILRDISTRPSSSRSWVAGRSGLHAASLMLDEQ